jgi:hypothetical protein
MVSKHTNVVMLFCVRDHVIIISILCTIPTHFLYFLCLITKTYTVFGSLIRIILFNIIVALARELY